MVKWKSRGVEQWGGKGLGLRWGERGARGVEGKGNKANSRPKVFMWTRKSHATWVLIGYVC